MKLKNGREVHWEGRTRLRLVDADGQVCARIWHVDADWFWRVYAETETHCGYAQTAEGAKFAAEKAAGVQGRL